MNSTTIDFLKKLGFYLLIYCIVYIIFSTLTVYGIIYSDTSTKMLTYGSLSFLLLATLLFFLFKSVLLLMHDKHYLGAYKYIKIAGICLLVGLIAGFVSDVFRIGLHYIFLDFYSDLNAQMQSAMIELYTKDGWDVAALKQKFMDDANITLIQQLVIDVKMMFYFSLVVGLITPLLLRKKLGYNK